MPLPTFRMHDFSASGYMESFSSGFVGFESVLSPFFSSSLFPLLKSLFHLKWLPYSFIILALLSWMYSLNLGRIFSISVPVIADHSCSNLSSNFDNAFTCVSFSRFLVFWADKSRISGLMVNKSACEVTAWIRWVQYFLSFSKLPGFRRRFFMTFKMISWEATRRIRGLSTVFVGNQKELYV